MAQNTRVYNRSFGAGELSPEMFGRLDDAMFQTGAATMRNFLPTPQGPVKNRPGFLHVADVKDSSSRTRIVPYAFSATQMLIIEMGAGYFRFHTQGSTYMLAGDVFEITNSYEEDDLFDIHYVQSENVMTFVHPKYPPMELVRVGPTSWTFDAISFSEPISAPSGLTATPYFPPSSTIDPDTFFDTHYTVTALRATDGQESEGCTAVTATNNLYVTGAKNTLAWAVVSGADRYRVYKEQGGLYGYIGETTGVGLVDDNIAPDLSITPPIYDDPFYRGTKITSVTVVTGGSGYPTTGGSIDNIRLVSSAVYGINIARPTAAVVDPTGTGAEISVQTEEVALGDGMTGWRFTGASVISSGTGYSNPDIEVTAASKVNGKTLWEVDFTPNPVTFTITDSGAGYGADLEAVVDAGIITGVVVRNGGYGYSDATTVAINNGGGGVGATFTPVIGTLNDYPGAVSYFEQRRCFAGTPYKSQNIWMTKSGLDSDMSYSIPLKDNDRIAFKAASREVNVIKHIVPLNDMVILTNAAEWRVGSVNSDAITPTSISVKPQSYIGASDVQPIVVNNTLVFCSARGGHVRELGYDFETSGLITGDLSIRATHLFDCAQIYDMGYSKSPWPILWFVSSTGVLLGLTYVPEQKLGAWHWHDTDGLFESVASVPEGDSDSVYVVVHREVNGVSRRTIERMMLQCDTRYLDAGVWLDGANKTGESLTLYPSERHNWITTIGHPYSIPGNLIFSNGYKLDVDSVGNTYIVGVTQDDGTGTETEAPYSILIAKFDPQGAVIWKRRVGSPAEDTGFDISVDEVQGRVYIAGRTENRCEEGNAPEITFDDVDSNTLVACFDTSGNKIWIRLYSSCAWDCASMWVLGDQGAQRVEARGGYVFISLGVYVHRVGSELVSSPAVAMLTSDGYVAWCTGVRFSMFEEPYGLAVDWDTGDSYVTARKGGVTKPVTLMKYAFDGDVDWASQYWNDNMAGFSEFRGLQLGSDGYLYGAVCVDQTSEDITGNLTLVMKLDTSGEIVWQRVYCSNFASASMPVSDLSLDEENNIYITCGSSSYVEPAVLKISPAGDLLAARSFTNTSHLGQDLRFFGIKHTGHSDFFHVTGQQVSGEGSTTGPVVTARFSMNDWSIGVFSLAEGIQFTVRDYMANIALYSTSYVTCTVLTLDDDYEVLPISLHNITSVDFTVVDPDLPVYTTVWDAPERPESLAGDELRIVSSKALFTGESNIGDIIVITDDDGTEYTLTISRYESSTVVYTTLKDAFPNDLVEVPVTDWAIGYNTIGGLTWLEGKDNITVWADGRILRDQEIVGGALTLSEPAVNIQIGIPYTCDLKTLPISLPVPGYGQGRVKNINKAWLRVYQSSGIFVGPDYDHLTEHKQRTTEPYGVVPTPITGEVEILVHSSWNPDGQICIRHTEPLSLTIVGLTTEVSIGS